jgi:hypothetical protein
MSELLLQLIQQRRRQTTTNNDGSGGGWNCCNISNTRRFWLTPPIANQTRRKMDGEMIRLVPRPQQYFILRRAIGGIQSESIE